MTAETIIMPFPSQRINVLPDNRLLALPAFRSSVRCAFRLAGKTPCVPILLDMRLAIFKRITAFGAEEMAVMPVFAEGDSVFTKDRSLAVLAFWGKSFMPVEVAVETHAFISIFCHGLPFDLREFFASCSASDSIKSLSTLRAWLKTYLKGFETSAAVEADEALGMEMLWLSMECYYAPFDG
jgi:hypothetical protein